MKSDELIRRKTRFGIDRYSIVRGRKIGSWFISDQLATGRENVIEKRMAGRPIMRRPSWAFRKVDLRKTGYFSWYGGVWVAKEEIGTYGLEFVEAKLVLISEEPIFRGPIGFEAGSNVVSFTVNLRAMGAENRHMLKISGAPNELDNGFKQIIKVEKWEQAKVKIKGKFVGNSGSETVGEIPNQLLADGLCILEDRVWFATRFGLYGGKFVREDLLEEVNKVDGVPYYEFDPRTFINHVYRCWVYKDGTKYVMITEERRTRSGFSASLRKYESTDLEKWNYAGYLFEGETGIRAYEKLDEGESDFFMGDQKTNLISFLGRPIDLARTSIFIRESDGSYEAYITGDFNQYLKSNTGRNWNYEGTLSLEREDGGSMNNGLIVLAVI